MTLNGLHMDLALFLKKVPLFSSIPDTQIMEIVSFFHVKELVKNDIVFRQDDKSDAMYIIRSGAVMIEKEIPGTQTPERVELRRGDFFGEMALLSEMPRNAAARVSLDAVLFYLKKEDFETLLSKNKQIGLFLSRLYARRLSHGPGMAAPPPANTFYTLCSSGPELGLSHFLYSTAYHISTESDKKVLVVEPHLELAQTMKKFELFTIPCPDESMFDILPDNVYKASDIKWFYHNSGFCVLQVNQGFSDQIVPVLPRLMESFKLRYDLVIFSLAHFFGDLERQAIRLCDKNLLLINNTPAALSDVRQKFKMLEQITGTGLDRIRVGVSHLCGTTGIPRETLKNELNLSETPQIWVERSDKAIKDQIDTEKKFPVKGARAIARELAGVRIGLALGAGAARGWSHIGVLKVLEEENIHIDMIAGTSMGALVGAIFAARGSVDHLMKTTIAQFPTRTQARKKIFDYTIPFRGFLQGRKAMNLVAAAVDNADFMDLMIPTYLVGVDIVRGEEILFETGDVARAVRSSLSLPGVFTPFRHMGRWMVDGGLLNPVPVNILEQKGADKIIAVCVENPHSRIRKDKKSPHILQVLLRTINIVHGRATSGFAARSDVVIYPSTQDYAWDDFHKGNILMRQGETACRKVLKEIKALL